MMRIVLDTNVVLDLFHWANVDAVPIMAALEAGRIECLADARTLDELQRVLTYPQLKLTPEMIAERWARYSALVKVVADGDAPPLPRCKDCRRSHWMLQCWSLDRSRCSRCCLGVPPYKNQHLSILMSSDSQTVLPTRHKAVSNGIQCGWSTQPRWEWATE